MRKIEEIPEEKLKQMQYYYDPLVAGICIQKYLETEDGKGDFIPVYANKTFAESMEVPFEMIYRFTLRQISQGFPDKELQDMVDVAFNGKVIIGDNFARDYSKYFSVRIYQYRYGYTIMFMTDVTLGHINAKTLHSVSRSYEAIYYARVSDPLCSKVYPASEANITNKTYVEMVEDMLKEYPIHPDDFLQVQNFLEVEELQKAVETEDSTAKRFRMKTDGQEYRWCIAEAIVNERKEGKPSAFVFTIKDIEDIVGEEKRKQEELAIAYEKVKKANDSKDKFLAHMSHDLRTPLNGILGMLQILESGEVPDEVRFGYRSKIRRSTENLLNLFNEVLELTRLESADYVMESKPYSLENVRRELESVLKKYEEEAEFILHFDSPKYPDRMGNEEYMRQIVLQLLQNAVKFNKDHNPIEITITEKEPMTLCFIIKDQGIGMSKEFQAQAFEPFAQEHGESRTIYEGSGLGLTYVKRIVEELKGTITFESVPGEGTTFEVNLPAEIIKPRVEEEKRKNTLLAGKKALVVEDNEINRMIVECFLDKEKILHDSAENGQIAVDKFSASKEDEYDVILMDIMMPVMNGLDATKNIRESAHKRAKTIPIIAVSANSFPEDIQKGMDVGMTAYLSKPLNKNLLIETMSQYIK